MLQEKRDNFSIHLQKTVATPCFVTHRILQRSLKDPSMFYQHTYSTATEVFPHKDSSKGDQCSEEIRTPMFSALVGEGWSRQQYLKDKKQRNVIRQVNRIMINAIFVVISKLQAAVDVWIFSKKRPMCESKTAEMLKFSASVIQILLLFPDMVAERVSVVDQIGPMFKRSRNADSKSSFDVIEYRACAMHNTEVLKNAAWITDSSLWCSKEWWLLLS